MRVPRTYHNPDNLVERFKGFAAHAESSSAILGFLEFAERPPLHVKFWEFVIYSKENLADVLLERFSHGRPLFQPLNPRASAFQLSVPARHTDERSLRGVIAVLDGSRPDIYRIVSISYYPFWDRAVRVLARRLYPDAMPVFFKQSEIKEALISLERSLYANRKLSISDATLKKRREGDAWPRFRHLDTERWWTDKPLQDVFDQALERNEWFTSIGFRVEDENLPPDSSVIASGRIAKNGELSFDFMFQEVNASLVSVLEALAAKRIALFQKRGIRERNYNPSLPIEISYASDVFSDIEEIRRFGRVVSKYPKATKAVFHANPYYHASVADFLDGSSFELWVLSPRRVLIVPQARSSVQAFERLISHIFAEFREGVTNEYNE
jgi:hypothetical protein